MLGRVFEWAEEGADEPEPHSGRPPRRRRRRWLTILLVLFLVALGLGTAGFSYYRWCEGTSGPQTPVTLTVPRGASGSEVVSMLHDRRVIRCGLMSRVVLRTTN